MSNWIITSTDDRRKVFNEHVGWVDRDIAPGATVFSDEYRKSITLEPGQEWEPHE